MRKQRVETNNERIVMHNPAWYQSGENLPVVVAPPINRMPQVQPMPHKQTEDEQLQRGFISSDDYQQIVVKLAGMLCQPMKRVIPLAQYKRVYLVEFVPHLAYDPVLPVTYVPLGQKHDDAFRYLSEWLIYWHPTGMEMSHNRWYQSCRGYVQTCIQAAANVLDYDEAQYYAREMMFTHANPDRRHLGARQTPITVGKIEY